MNEEELRDYQMWTMEELQTYLLEVVSQRKLKSSFILDSI